MTDSPETKIWKYMDLGKFISLLTTKSLYFACPSQFQDLSEGTLPKSHMEALSEMLQKQAVGPTLALRPQFAALGLAALQEFDGIVKKLTIDFRDTSKKATFRFGVSCWHKSEYESEAMWKLYAASGQGIAIESTIGQLKASLGNPPGLVVGAVRYVDFESADIEKGHEHYGLFMKKNCFGHEKELRAIILLPEEQHCPPEKQRGLSVPCDLDVLINRVHVSPLFEGYVSAAVENFCHGKAHCLRKPVCHSKLFSDSGYKIEVDLSARQ